MPDHRVFIRVTDREGDPVSHARVSIHVYQFAGSGSIGSQNTDSDGETVFEFEADSSAEVEVFVNGRDVARRGKVRDAYYVTV